MRKIDADALQKAMEFVTNDPTCPMHIAATIDQIIDCAPTVDDWIPCSERMPDSEERCLVFTKSHDVGISRRMGRNLRGEWTCYGYEVTHWMPLPEPPKEVQHVDEPHR